MTPSFKLSDRPLKDTVADAHVALVWEGAPLTGTAKSMDTLLRKALSSALRAKTITGKAGEVFLYPLPGASKGKFLLLLGVGKKSDANLNLMRNAGGWIVSAAKSHRFKSVAVPLAEFDPLGSMDADDCTRFAQALTEGIVLRNYVFDDLRKEKEEPVTVKTVTIVVSKDKTQRAAVQGGVDRGIVLAESANFARDLINLPPNVKTPSYLAARAQEIGKNGGKKLKVSVFNRKQCAEMGMGAYLGVAQGSVEEPKFIVLEYKCGKANAPTVALVGKAITFDTGGISIKPAQGMEAMKYDMSGGAGVLGTMRAMSYLQPDCNVVGIVPATDNMPDGNAIHPADVLTSMSGLTIEIISTDAEGRLILADGLHYAKQYNPDAVVDMATLTGACVIALGNSNAAVMGNNPNLTKQLMRAGKISNEKVWELPLDAEYNDQIKSAVADVKNSGGRPAGSITAGAFLQKFVGDMAWAHLDIAGMAWEESGRPYVEKGAVGFGVRLLSEFILEFEPPVKAG